MESTTTSATAMDAVTSFLKNPGGGASDVALNEGGKMTGGAIMGAIGLGAAIVGYLLSGMPFVGEVLVHMVVIFVILFAVMFGMNFIGVQMGNGEKSPGEAMLGAGGLTMFLGIVLVLAILISKVLASSSSFMAALNTTIMVGLFLMLGAVAYGLWTNRYKVPGMQASILAGFTVSAALGFGMWIYASIMGGGIPMGGLGRMF